MLFGQRGYPPQQASPRKTNLGLFLVYLIFGLYLINTKFSFLQIPDAFSSLNDWIIVIAGGLLVLSAIMTLLRVGRAYY
jgi:hypothetical protein